MIDVNAINNENAIVRVRDLHKSFGRIQVLNGIDCDILKVGHHGSSTSTTSAFLAAVTPDVAVISCGAGNEYGHPHTETMNKLEGANVETYRTDYHGDVVIKTDGERIEIVIEKTTANAIELKNAA